MKNIIENIDWKKATPYVGAVLIFIILSLAYVYPVLQGKRLLQPDIVKFEGMAKEIKDFRAETGEEALWTNSMFGGMPAFQISVIYSNNVARFFHNLFTLGLPRPADMIFLYFAGFFIFLLMLKVNPWIAFLGALGFAFSSYHFIIIEAGHNAKALAIAYMAPILASIIYTFRGNYIPGAILFALFLALQLFSNHLQITYYLLILVVFYGIFELADQIKNKQLPNFIRASGILVAAAIVAVGVNMSGFWGTYEYTSETMRGGSELTIGEEQHASGLSREYITAWSYGKMETLTLLVPNLKGGASAQISENQTALNAVEPALRRNVGQASQYWGEQPFTSGPVYVGAVVLFLFFMSLFFLKGPLKWGFLTAAILAIMLSWGRNFMPLTDFFIDYVPGYNKFRAVSMTLVIAELVIPALAFLGLHQVFTGKVKIHLKHPAILTALAFTAGVSLILYLFPRAFFSFINSNEVNMFSEWIAEDPAQASTVRMVEQNLVNARVALLQTDAIRSFGFAMATAAVLLFFAAGKLKNAAFVVVLALLLVFDMWPVNRRYFDSSGFVPRRQVENPFQPTQANRQILQDNDLHFRVYNVTVSSFNETSTSWFHRSIGGYHGAKLQRYQELIDYHITQGNMDVLHMLNTRYFIVPGPDRQPAASFNDDALGNAWFASELQWVENANEEILELYEIDPGYTALVDQRFSHYIETEPPAPESTDHIELIHYQPNKLIYTSRTSGPRLALFSEVYYPHGWKVFVNGEEADHFRANYILRGMIVPEGENEIEFRFEPRSFFLGERISFAFSALLVLSMAGFVFLKLKAWRKS